MFENLTDKLGNVFKGLTKRGSLSEGDVDKALKEVRSALLEADVALSVVKEFIDKVRVRAVGEEVLRSVTPGQQVIKIVNDVLIEVLGSDQSELLIDHAPPAVILLVGLHIDFVLREYLTPAIIDCLNFKRSKSNSFKYS